MANILKLRGGTTAEVAAAVLQEREIMVDTTKDVIVVGPTKKEMAVGNGGTYTGNYTFSGDVTISGGVTLGTSANANSLRIQNVATPTGNSDAANKSYVDTQITSVQNTTLPGNVFSASNTIDITDNNPGVGDVDLALADNAVSTAKIQNSAVTTAKIANNSVTGDKFANNSIVTAKLQDQAVTTAKIEVSAITANRIAAGAVSSTKIADANVTAIKLANDSVTTDKIQDDAVTAAKIGGLTATITELNQVDNKTLVPGSVTWTSTSELPSAAQINSRIAAVVDAVGGFVAIPDETSFPASHPDPNGNAGTVISIADAGGLVIGSTGQGVGTKTGGGVVLIKGFPASMHSTTLAAGMGLQVQTTSTAHTYDYHKLIAKEDDILQLSDDINDFNNRYRIGAADPSSDNDSGDLFFNTTGNRLKVHDGTSWSLAAAANAGDVSSNAVGNLAATNVQAALQELQGDIDSLDTNKVPRTNATGAALVPSGTTAQRTGLAGQPSVATGHIRFNSELIQFEGYNGTSWGKIGGGGFDVLSAPPTSPTPQGGDVYWDNDEGIPYIYYDQGGGQAQWIPLVPQQNPKAAEGGGSDEVFHENDQAVTTDYTIATGRNAMTAGPITINSGATVTVSAGSTWVIV